MSCSGVFTYSSFTTLYKSSQYTTFGGTASIPGYSIGESYTVRICYCPCCGWWGCSGWCCCQNVTESITIPLYPSIDVSGNGTMKSIIQAGEEITFTTSAPSNDTIYSFIITNIDINLVFVFGGTTVSTGNFELLPNNTAIEIDYDKNSGTFDASVTLAEVNGEYEGVGMTLATYLLFCEQPTGGTAWVNLVGTISLTCEGITMATNFTFPLTE